MSVFPVDKRMITKQKRALMSPEEVTDLVDEKLAFKALCKEIQYKAPSIKDKDKLFRDNYIKSMIHK